MTTIVSTGFKAGILGPQSFEQLMDGGIIRLYSGTQPDSADDAVPGGSVELGTISAPGGLQFTRTGGTVLKAAFQAWLLEGAAPGTLGWFRLYASPLDDGSATLSAVRIDGTISPSGEMRLPAYTVTSETTRIVDNFAFSLPYLSF